MLTYHVPWSNDDTTEAAQYLAKKAQEGFDEWERLGRIYTREQGDLILFNYTAQAQYEGDFNAFEAVSRGLVIDKKSGKVVARPFDKFFNWGERGMVPNNHAHMTHVSTKIDGSLIVVFWYDEFLNVITRGSFDSNQAHLAKTLLVKAPRWLRDLPKDLTLMFELIHPDNRIVVDYGDTKDLYLLAARITETGEYLPHFPNLWEFADKFHFELPLQWSFNNPTEIMASCGKLGPNAEGYVAEFSDGTFWKFKGDEYLELHKIATGLSEKKVARLMRDGTLDDLVARLPEHLRKQIEEWRERIINQANARLRFAEACYLAAPDDRKALALYLKDEDLMSIAPYIFAMDDGRSRDFVFNMILDREHC